MAILNIRIFEALPTMIISDWTVAAAKARLSELIERARAKGPQTITRRG